MKVANLEALLHSKVMEDLLLGISLRYKQMPLTLMVACVDFKDHA